MDIMITNFNLHLTVFHVKCKVRNSKKAFVSVFIYRTRGLQMTEAFAVRKTDDKTQKTKSGGAFERRKPTKSSGERPPMAGVLAWY